VECHEQIISRSFCPTTKHKTHKTLLMGGRLFMHFACLPRSAISSHCDGDLSVLPQLIGIDSIDLYDIIY